MAQGPRLVPRSAGIDRASAALVNARSAVLVNARSAAEVLEAKELAGAAYDEAKRLGRLARAKSAHDDLIAAVLRSQADAAEIEAGAKRRLADEYTAAQDRGEVARLGTNQRGEGISGRNTLPTAAELRISRKEIHDGRLIRDSYPPHVGLRRAFLEGTLDTLSEPTLEGLATRLDWLRYRTEHDLLSDINDDLTMIDAMRLDVAALRRASATMAQTSQGMGQPRTNAEKRDAVLSMLDAETGLSDREIGRRVGVSPQTVNNWRKRRSAGA